LAHRAAYAIRAEILTCHVNGPDFCCIDNFSPSNHGQRGHFQAVASSSSDMLLGS
jgi:hypothetical protein